ATSGGAAAGAAPSWPASGPLASKASASQAVAVLRHAVKPVLLGPSEAPLPLGVDRVGAVAHPGEHQGDVLARLPLDLHDVLLAGGRQGRVGDEDVLRQPFADGDADAGGGLAGDGDGVDPEAIEAEEGADPLGDRRGRLAIEEVTGELVGVGLLLGGGLRGQRVVGGALAAR